MFGVKERIKQLIRYHTIKRWYEKYERLLMPITLVLGSVLDFVTFASVTISTTFLLLGVYVAVATGGIVYMALYDAGKIASGRITSYLRMISALVVQFSFGALLSGSMVFYFFSGAVSVSWPIIAIFVALMIANEVFRKQYARVSVQLGVYFFIILSFVSVLLPFIFRTIASWVFVVASAVSVIYMALLVYGLARVVPTVNARVQRIVSVTVVGIVSVMQWLYFSHVIPPVPLALRDIEIAHSLVRRSSGYELQIEQTPWWNEYVGTKKVHIRPGQRVYVYNAIFAPEGLNTTAVHHWQLYDEATKTWRSRDRLTYEMVGGNRVGYHGYSYKTTLTPGLWRVDIETVTKHVIGRVEFRVVTVTDPPALETVIRW